ncbi:MAG: hypothetical protein QM727_03270 [Niabella sp.]
MRLWVISAIILFCSCKITDKNLLGKYTSQPYQRSIIILDSNNQFRYWSDGLELAFNGNEFLYTEGTWARAKGNKLTLNSISDSIKNSLFDIKKQELNGANKSRFVFLNQEKDSILIYTICKNRDIIFYRSHGPFLIFFEDSVIKSDTLTFTFAVGYDPVKILIDTNAPTEFQVTLNREFRPNYFYNTEFKIRRNKLIKVIDKTKFRKAKDKDI